MSSPARAYIGLGSNLDQPEQQIERAVAALRELASTRLIELSPLYQSKPWGDPDQGDFTNAVAMVDTGLSPQALLESLLAIEQQQGRDRRSARRNGPRTLDLDLLCYGDWVIDQPGLQLPHPRMAERAFVLVPLSDLAPDLLIPGQGVVSSLLRPEFASLCWRLPLPGAIAPQLK
jgi:2-amino-4-hydroxy-6-hydroxymethyldihydropteridine diphosphokinase